VIENDHLIVLWDMKLQTDKVIEHSRPDIVTLNKNMRESKLIDVTCPFDTRVLEKERGR